MSLNAYTPPASLAAPAGRSPRGADQSPAPVLQMPTDRPRTDGSDAVAAQCDFRLPAALTRQIEHLAFAENNTVFVATLAAFKILLTRYTGQEGIALGVVPPGAAGDGRTWALHTDLGGDPGYREALARVKAAVAAAGGVDDELRQIVFSLSSTQTQTKQAANGTHKACGPELALELTPDDDGLTGTLRYNAVLYDAETVRRLADHFHTLLESIVANPDAVLSALNLSPAAEQRRLLVDWNRTHCDYPRDATINGLFEAQARRTPEAVAVVDDAGDLTYAALNATANRLAHYLRSLGVGPEIRVGVCMGRSSETVAAVFAVLKAGGAYVPLDPAYPAERLRFMIRDSGLELVLTQRHLAGDLARNGARTVCLDDAPAPFSDQPATDPAGDGGAERLAYVIYTSGSTGTPKGVVITHRNVSALVHWARSVFSDEDLQGVLASTTVCFDLSAFELFAPLSWGGAAIVAENALALPSLAARDRVTLLNTGPSAAAELVRQRAIPQSVRTVCLAGEPLTRELADALYLQGAKRVFDLYGPSEDTTYSTCALRRPGGPATIGRPIANTRAYLLDEGMRPVPLGLAGELYLGGDGLARGYLGRPGLTAEKFIPDPFSQETGAHLYRTGDLARYRRDGDLEFLGRIDHQVKIRGFRVELGEIESALEGIDGVVEAVALAREDTPGRKRLVAYVGLQVGGPAEETLRSHLKRTLPSYMLPAAIVTLDRLPRTPNGKVDRKALPAPQAPSEVGEGSTIAPRDTPEAVLTEIWEQVLDVRPVGIHDDFFDLGGDSLLAARLVCRLEEVFGRQIPIAALMQAPTVACQAAYIAANRGSSISRTTSLVPIHPAGDRPPLFWVHGVTGHALHYYNLSRHLDANQPTYGLEALTEPCDCIGTMAQNYLAEIRALRPQGPYLLGGYSFGGIVAYEMARLLREEGEEVPLLALLESSPANVPTGGWNAGVALHLLRNLPFWLADLLRKPSKKIEKIHRTFIESSLINDPVKRLAPEQIVDVQAYGAENAPYVRAFVKAVMDYVPPPYPGRITLFRTRELSRIHLDPWMRWESLAQGGVEVETVPGHHGDMIFAARAQELAAKLQKHL